MPESSSTSPHESIARAALLEVTPAATVGAFIDAVDGDDGVVDLRFASTQDAYRGWSWVVTVAAIDDGGEPTVLELGLIPGEHALLPPEWVPWSVRLAEWEAHQAELAAAGLEVEDVVVVEDDDEDADDDESDEDDDDDDESDDDDDDDESDDDDDDESDDDDDDESDDDDDDDDESEVRSTHGGDIDGIDVDSFDPDAVADDEE